MPISSRYLFIASMDVDPDKEALFNEVYDKEHCPSLMEVPGVVAIARFKMRDLEMSIAGERKVIKFENEPKYHAMYEVESPDVLVSDQWGKAVEMGRWPEQVRPFTSNRRHILSQRLD